ncbi:MAG: class I SAM-dependent methyltransferase [Candidatus Andersenbacteria bacterium]
MTTETTAIQEYFERLYQRGITPWTEHGFEPEISQFADQLLASNPKPTLLDIGCGNGWVSIYFAKRGLRIDGIDSAPTAIADAQEQAEQEEVSTLAHFQVGDGLELPYHAAAFDAVFDRGFFHHVLPDHYEQYLTGVHRVLKPGGLLSLHAFTTNNHEDIGHRFTSDDIEKIFGERFTLLSHSTDPWPTNAPAHLGHYLLQAQ